MIRRLLEIPYSVLRSREARRLHNSHRELKYPPIFIIGAPRSGTTLLYQLLVQRFHVAYFPNIADLLNKAPVTATKLGRRFCKPYRSDFESNYGRVAGKLAPSEAGGIWNRWYPYEEEHGFNYTPAGYFEKADRHLIYQIVAGVEAQFGFPFVNKNTKHSVRIQSLNEIFPKALFLQVTRDPEATAVSILHGRKKRTDDVREWWSAMPKEIDELRHKDVLEQVAGQVFYIEKNIRDDIEFIGRERLLEIQYEELCAKTQEMMLKTQQFAQDHGCILTEKFEVPESFPISSSKKDVSAEELSRMRELLSRYYKEEAATS